MGSNVYFYTLTGGGGNGEFSPKVSVNDVAATQSIGGPLNYASISASSTTKTGNNIMMFCPACSIVHMVADKK